MTWKPIAGYQGYYEINEQGEIKSLSRTVRCGKGTTVKPSKLIAQKLDNHGYKCVVLWRHNSQRRFRVHRLVAETFLPAVSGKPHVNHVDKCKTNNHLANLEWVTVKENNDHSFSDIHNDTQKRKIRALNKGKATPVICHDIETNTLTATYPSITKASEAFGLTKSAIAYAVKHHTPCAGYYWHKI